MPKSNYGGKLWSHKILKRFNRESKLTHFLDVGPGIGTYSKFRQPEQVWTGVEVWAPYIKTYELESLYDQVIVCDIRFLDWEKVKPVDVVIFGDVLEHMSKDDALITIERALTHARLVLISIPLVYSAQGELEGNPFEIHVKPDWSNREALESFIDWQVYILESVIGVYILSRRENDIAVLRDVATHLQKQVQ